ncbi:hypothetical protein DERP_009499 [Dermatophagoides pteronyssinus]|uniref:Uncharacterized protein n=1 Tax=Dermatophagoides pteronyssinus TaxID=6956 RepID=A0ABQ8IUB8_DERPT|nr:hypothetical protein DERP_009499 [Dermatophagoides pteronyssinus]
MNSKISLYDMILQRKEKWNFPVLRIKLTRTQENRPLESYLPTWNCYVRVDECCNIFRCDCDLITSK